MKKLLITVCLSGLLSVPSAVLGAEMAGPSLYGSFRTGLAFGDGDASVSDFTSRWGFKGSHEVSEGLTASYKYESRFDSTDATTAGHRHTNVSTAADTRNDNDGATTGACEDGGDPDGGSEDCHSLWADDGVSGGGRLSYIALSGGFGTITLGQIWSASAIHYGFAVDPSYVNGVFGGANYRNGNSVSYASNAGDVSFQIDKVTGDAEKLELGASATLGPVGIGLANWSNANDEAGFTGLAVSAGAAGVNLTIGLGSTKDEDGVKSKMNILHVGGSVGDTGLSYALQVANSDADGGAGDQNLIVVTNSLGSGASLIFEHVSHGDDTESSSLLGLKVDF